MKRITLLLLLPALFVSVSCQKEGCTDPLSYTYDKDADTDNGNCKYYYGGKEFGQLDIGSQIDLNNEFDVYIDDNYLGRALYYFPDGLSCGNPQAIGTILSSGTHKITAIGNGGSEVIEGFAMLDPQECKVVLLENLMGGSSGDCSGPYVSPTTDAQLDAYCGAAYAYRCLQGKTLSDPSVVSVCSSYDLIKTSSAPPCPYCN